MQHNSAILAGAALLLWVPLQAQRERTPPLRSAEVHADRTITFRLHAPKATEVAVNANFLKGPKPMQKDEQGLWTVSVGPVEPAIYGYTFVVDGVRIADPNSGFLHPGTRSVSSMVEVPGDGPMFYDVRPVPHGVVHAHWYESKAVAAERSVWVYTPPGYENGQARYPVLYLLHGSGDTENAWVTIGRANVILDNLLADRKAVPMVVVMPFGHAQPGIGFGPLPETTDSELFTRDLLEEIMPMVERSYRIDARPEMRAIAGLSMGGGQSLNIGLTHLDRFRWIGVFSAGIRDDSESRFRDVFADPAAANRKIKLFWIACGKADTGFGRARQLDALLTKHGISHSFLATEGAHYWSVWRGYLHQMAPLLFR